MSLAGRSSGESQLAVTGGESEESQKKFGKIDGGGARANHRIAQPGELDSCIESFVLYFSFFSFLIFLSSSVVRQLDFRSIFDQ